jgi:hypothetical protein
MTALVVPYHVSQGKRYLFGVLPHVSDDQLAEIATRMLGAPSNVRILIKRPIETDGEMELKALREEDHVKEAPKTVMMMHHMLIPASPRPKARELPEVWGISAQKKKEFT